MQLRRGPLEVRLQRFLLFIGALVLRSAQRLQHLGRQSVIRGSLDSGVLGIRPGILGRRKSQAKSADGGPAILGILLEPHRDFGIRLSAQGFGEAQRQKQIPVLTGAGDSPAGLGVAIERPLRRVGTALLVVRGHRREIDRLAAALQGEFAEHEIPGILRASRSAILE